MLKKIPYALHLHELFKFFNLDTLMEVPSDVWVLFNFWEMFGCRTIKFVISKDLNSMIIYLLLSCVLGFLMPSLLSSEVVVPPKALHTE